MDEGEINAKSSSSPQSFLALLEEDDNEKPGGGHLLPKLLSELESMEEKANNVSDESKQEANAADTTKGIDNCSNEEMIIKELKNIKRQNTITHRLVSAMIVLTLAWQLSEVSLVLKIRDGLSNPLRSVGGVIGGFFKNRREVASVQDVIKQVSEKQKQVIEPTSLPGLKIPGIPHLGLPGFDTSNDEED